MTRRPDPASIRTEVMVPLCFSDGFRTMARVITFDGLVDRREHLALGLGHFADRNRPGRPRRRPPLVRLHSECLTGDVFGSVKCDCGRQLHQTMKMIEQEGRGAVVYQQQEGRGIGIVNKIRAYALQDQGADTVEANEKLGLAVDLRDYRQCAEILFDLGLCQVKVISNNPLKLRALEEAGLKIVERVSIEVDAEEDAAGYLRTKKEKLGHLLELKRS